MQDVTASPSVLYILTLRWAPCEVIPPGGPVGAELMDHECCHGVLL